MSLEDPDREFDNCTFCNTSKETFFHWATECPALILSRNDHFLDKPPSDDLEWKVNDIIKFSEIPSLERIIAGELAVDSL